jgi:hypothetical protein
LSGTTLRRIVSLQMARTKRPAYILAFGFHKPRESGLARHQAIVSKPDAFVGLRRQFVTAEVPPVLKVRQIPRASAIGPIEEKRRNNVLPPDLSRLLNEGYIGVEPLRHVGVRVATGAHNCS